VIRFLVIVLTKRQLTRRFEANEFEKDRRRIWKVLIAGWAP
jgi:hypothetical protein